VSHSKLMRFSDGEYRKLYWYEHIGVAICVFCVCTVLAFCWCWEKIKGE